MLPGHQPLVVALPLQLLWLYTLMAWCCFACHFAYFGYILSGIFRQVSLYHHFAAAVFRCFKEYL